MTMLRLIKMSKTCADSIYDYTRAERQDYVNCQKRTSLIIASIVTGVFVLILIGSIVASLSIGEPLPGLIVGGAFILFVGGAWAFFGASEYLANSRFDQHDRKVELGLAANSSKTEAQVLIELRQAEIDQQNFNRAVSRPIYGATPTYGSSFELPYSSPTIGFRTGY